MVIRATVLLVIRKFPTKPTWLIINAVVLAKVRLDPAPAAEYFLKR